MISLCGKPLCFWTINAALESKSVDRIILSTDSPEIQEIGLALGIQVPTLRPKHLSQDSTTTHQVVIHHLNELKSDEEYLPDNIIILQPTSPLRTSHDIDMAIEKFESNQNADSLVSYTKLPSSLHPSKLMEEKLDGFLTSFSMDETWQSKLETIQRPWIRNGAAIYVTRYPAIFEGIMIGNLMGFEMPWLRSVDIDTPEDLKLAEILLASQLGKDIEIPKQK
jgi:CMP-N,N'-diacetyllegionaminic acid synthase